MSYASRKVIFPGAPGVSPSSIPPGFQLPQMQVVVNFAMMHSKVISAPVQAIEGRLIAKSGNMDTKMDNMMAAFEAWIF
jgi:hypothetical protein